MEAASVPQCVRRAVELASNANPVFLSDAGDNITGGGVGDVPVVLEEMINAGVRDAVYAAIVDREAVATCYECGTGMQVRLELGGKLDTVNGAPLAMDGRVVHVRHGIVGGRQAVVESRGLRIVITEERTAFTTVRQFEDLRIDLSECSIVGVKLGYLFPELQEVARHALLAMSPGVINPAVTELSYNSIRRPIYPLDPSMEWAPG
jgi:microcystin degradation protein MlrC